MDIKQSPAKPALNQKTPQFSAGPSVNAAGAARATSTLDRVCWESEDGLVRIKQLVRQAQKHPPSDYPCVVIQALPQEHERIRRIWGDTIELLLTYQEVEQLITALNAAAEAQGTGQLYQILQRVAPKPKWRKERWKKFNQRRTR
jgi:hypothetical protein